MIESNPLDKATSLFVDLQNQYPLYPTGFVTCSTEGCNRQARINNKCGHCLEADMAKLIGAPLAHDLHMSIQESRELWRIALDELQTT